MSDSLSAYLYLYAVARSFGLGRLAGVRGVDGVEVQLVGDDDLVAVVSPLRAVEAEGLAFEDRLHDPAELEAVARAHHAVVEAVAINTTAVPFRLGVVHRGEARVVEVLRGRRWQLEGLLDRFAGRVELGVKVYAVPAATEPATVVPASASSSSEASPGRAYLQQRRDETRLREEAWERVLTAARRIDAALAELADDRRQHPPQEAGDNILNSAYLVAAPGLDGFFARAGALEAESPDVDVVVTGPWAPYSFVDGEDEDEERSA